MNPLNKYTVLLILSICSISPLFGQTWIQKSFSQAIESVMMRQYIEDSSLNNKFQPVDKNAVPTIGPHDFVQKINNSYRFPNDAVDHKVEGYVEVRFYVDENGNAMDYKIVQDLGYGTGPELVKRLKTHESWFPAKYKGKDIGVWINYVLYLNFRDLTIN